MMLETSIESPKVPCVKIGFCAPAIFTDDEIMDKAKSLIEKQHGKAMTDNWLDGLAFKISDIERPPLIIPGWRTVSVSFARIS